MKKLKVLQIITRIDKGGSAEDIVITAMGLDKERYELTLMSGPVEDPSQDRKKEIEGYGIRHIFIPELVRNINLFKDLMAFLKIYRVLRKEKFDIVHTHTSKAGLLGRLAAKMARVPIIIYTPHGHVFFGYFSSLKTKIFILLEKLASPLADKIVALTNGEKEDYIVYKIASERKLAIICSGVDLNRFKELSSDEKRKIKKELGIPENSLVVGTAGRLVPIKGLEFLVEASKIIVSKYPDTYFLFAGDGPLRQSLEKKACRMGVKDNIIFLGWRDDVPKIISIFDIFVLPSLNEGMGRVLVEAMSLGKPIVASEIGGIPDLVIHGKNGFLVPPKNPKELAKYIQILLDNEEKRQKLGLAGKRMAVNFSAQIMLKKTSNLYEELLKQKSICGDY
jgi:glycosyltransferase involved in cell wall biosynthesis